MAERESGPYTPDAAWIADPVVNLLLALVHVEPVLVPPCRCAFFDVGRSEFIGPADYLAFLDLEISETLMFDFMIGYSLPQFLMGRWKQWFFSGALQRFFGVSNNTAQPEPRVMYALTLRLLGINLGCVLHMRARGIPAESLQAAMAERARVLEQAKAAAAAEAGAHG